MLWYKKTSYVFPKKIIVNDRGVVVISNVTNNFIYNIGENAQGIHFDFDTKDILLYSTDHNGKLLWGKGVRSNKSVSVKNVVDKNNSDNGEKHLP